MATDRLKLQLLEDAAKKNASAIKATQPRFKKMTRVTFSNGVIEPLWCLATSALSVENLSAL